MTADASLSVGKDAERISPCREWFALLALCQSGRRSRRHRTHTRRAAFVTAHGVLFVSVDSAEKLPQSFPFVPREDIGKAAHESELCPNASIVCLTN